MEYRQPTGLFNSPQAPPLRSSPSPIGQQNAAPTASVVDSAGLPPVPSPVTATASSTGGTGFGFTPDLSGLSPQQLQHIQTVLGNLTYSVPAGGYLFRAEANDPNSAYVKGYYGQNIGSDPGANREAADIYNLIGSQPTVARGTPALNQFDAAKGVKPSPQPSLNDRLGNRGPYGGPFTTPLYNPFKI